MTKTYDWNNLSERRKQELSRTSPIFVIGAREMSAARILELAKQLSAKSPVLWGCLKDEFIPGLEGSPQFRSLGLNDLEKALNNIDNNIAILHYYQRDWVFINQELKFRAVIFINGSWHKMLHLRPEFWQIERQKYPYKLVSPFASEEEAIAYSKSKSPELKKLGEYSVNKKYDDEALMKLSLQIGKRSYDNMAQVGVVIAKKGKVMLTTHNVVVPYETYALHHGSAKEKHFSPINDQNHYDTCHAEMVALLEAQKQGLVLKGTDLFISLLPCPACAKALALSDISRVVYQHDHSDGLGAQLLMAAGKKVERLLF